MRVLQIDHVNIRTPIFEETLDFYERCFGFKRGPAASASGRKQNVWLYTPDGAPLIHVNGPKPEEEVAEAGAPSRLHHVALACEGLPAWRARLDAEGVAYTQARLQGRDVTQINVIDPNGILVELNFNEL